MLIITEKYVDMQLSVLVHNNNFDFTFKNNRFDLTFPINGMITDI